MVLLRTWQRLCWTAYPSTVLVSTTQPKTTETAIELALPLTFPPSAQARLSLADYQTSFTYTRVAQALRAYSTTEPIFHS